MSVQTIPLPSGWEAKHDARTSRYYFINHSERKTQWDDPRLNHPEVWSGGNQWRTSILESLKDLYINCPENVIRQTLVQNGFDESRSKVSLTMAGYQQQVVRESSPTVSDRSEAVMDTPTPRSFEPTQEQVDPFAKMKVKSRFPQVGEALIEEILQSVDSDSEAAIAQLTSMGYEDRMEADRKREEEQKRQEEERRREIEERQLREMETRRKQEEQNRVRARITSEFPFVSSGYVSELLEALNFDHDRIHQQLLSEENSKVLAEEFPGVDVSEIEILLGTTNQDLEMAKRILKKTIEKQKDEPKRRHSALPHHSKDKRKHTQPSPSRLNAEEVKERSSRSVPDVREQVSPSRSQPRPSQPQSSWTHKTVALGPDPSLAKGPDRSLLTGGSSLAAGPDPSNRAGPDPGLLEHARFRQEGPRTVVTAM